MRCIGVGLIFEIKQLEKKKGQEMIQMPQEIDSILTKVGCGVPRIKRDKMSTSDSKPRLRYPYFC